MDFIGEYQISPEICDALVEYFERPDTFKFSDTILVQSHTDSTDAFLCGDTRMTYLDEFAKCMHSYIDTWPNCKILLNDWGIHEDIVIRKYAPGGGSKTLHCERPDSKGKLYKRVLAFETHLEDGGETVFLHQNHSIKPVKGTTVIWPVDWTHARKVTSSKFVVCGWISFDEQLYVGLSRVKSDSVTAPVSSGS